MLSFGLPLWALLPWLFVLGAVLGSFLNVCIHRFPAYPTLGRQLRAIWWPPSHCPGCGSRILLRDNVPVIGWLWLRGRCRSCGRRISFRYPLVEALNGLLFVAVYWLEIVDPLGAAGPGAAGPDAVSMAGMFGSAGISLDVLLHWRYAFHMLLLEALVVATFIDIEHRIIPDGCTVPAMLVAVAVGFLIGPVHLMPVWFQDPILLDTLRAGLPESLHPLLNGPRLPAWILAHPHWHGLTAAIVGLLVGGGIVWGVRLVGGWILRKEAMGFGDVILMAMIGSFLGWQGAVIVFFLAPLCALLVVALSAAFRREAEIPYGPYLSFAALLVIAAWPIVWRNTERIFSLGAVLPLLGLFMFVLLAACLGLMQLGKRLLGIRDEEEWPEEWTSADQLHYQACENADASQGRWRTPHWPGIDTARGEAGRNRWHDG